MRGKRTVGYVAIICLGLGMVRCADYSKTQTTCTVNASIVIQNRDHVPYFFMLSDTTTFADSTLSVDDTAEFTFTGWSITSLPFSDTLEPGQEDSVQVTASWKATHYTPWDENVCSRAEEALRFSFKLIGYDTVFFKDTVIRQPAGGVGAPDTVAIDTFRLADTLIYQRVFAMSCANCFKVFTEAQSGTADSLINQSEVYTCHDTITIQNSTASMTD